MKIPVDFDSCQPNPLCTRPTPDVCHLTDEDHLVLGGGTPTGRARSGALPQAGDLDPRRLICGRLFAPRRRNGLANLMNCIVVER
jgi:hypothetical protein